MQFVFVPLCLFAAAAGAMASIGIGLAVLYSDLRARDSLLSPSMRAAHWSLNQKAWPHACFWLVVAVPPLQLLLAVFTQLAYNSCSCCCGPKRSNDGAGGMYEERAPEGEAVDAVRVRGGSGSGEELQMTRLGAAATSSAQQAGSSSLSTGAHHHNPAFDLRPASFLYY